MLIPVFCFCYAGCFCVYNSLRGLEYIQESLEKTLLSDVCEDRLPFQGLPVGVVLAHDPSHTEKDLMILRDGGQSLADRYLSKCSRAEKFEFTPFAKDSTAVRLLIFTQFENP